MARQYPLDRIRNIGIMAHIDAGKTTMSERLLFYTGRTHKIGNVDTGNTVMDWMPQEKERGITITAAATTLVWKNHKISLIDTPGHVDFTVEVERSLRVLDGAVALFCGVGGVEPQSISVWRQAAKYGVPVIAFINKLDRVGSNFFGVVDEIRQHLNANPVPITLPLGEANGLLGVIDLVEGCEVVYDDDQGVTFTERPISPENKELYDKWRKHLIESVSEQDEHLLEKFAADQPISKEELRAVLRKATLKRIIVPVLCGSAFRNKGVQRLLDAVLYYLPAPQDLPPVVAKNPKGEEVIYPVQDDAPLTALAFKIQADKHMGKMVFVRVYSGTLKSGTYVLNSTKDKRERVGRLVEMHANQQYQREDIATGEIGAVIGFGSTITGDTICDEEKPVLLRAIEFPTPVIGISIQPASKADRDKLGSALASLADEDPTFVVNVDPETSETIISGMGELHLEILVDRLKREYNVQTTTGRPQVAFRETITAESDVDYKYAKQSGGRGQFARVCLRLEPNPGQGFEFVNEVRGGNVPKEFIPAVEKGIVDAMQKGPYARFPVVDMKAVLYDGAYHEVDSSERAFFICASIAFKEAFMKGRPQLLEPVMKVDVTCNPDYTGSVTTDLASRRGQVNSMESLGGDQVVDAYVPLAQMFGYATDLRTITKGRGTFTMEFHQYLQVPANVAEEVVAKRKASADKDARK